MGGKNNNNGGGNSGGNPKFYVNCFRSRFSTDSTDFRRLYTCSTIEDRVRERQPTRTQWSMGIFPFLFVEPFRQQFRLG